ncbi:hypothetical protein LWS67_21825, partial [Bacillus atrophaeus]|uniref:hypothetical protein n=1 Tax=Bacillus atrophaeus TaxID=1452 RepID=UPI001EFABAF2
ISIEKEDGTYDQVSVPVIHTLKTRALIEEAIQFDPEINVDRIRAMGMVMIYRQEYIIRYGDNMNAESREKYDEDDLSNDPYFRNNYDLRFGSKFS